MWASVALATETFSDKKKWWLNRYQYVAIEETNGKDQEDDDDLILYFNAEELEDLYIEKKIEARRNRSKKKDHWLAWSCSLLPLSCGIHWQGR